MLKGLISRGSTDICADCSTTDPKWASINRGVLICDECCSVHRSLGRHISQVKSLKKGSWTSTQLAMVHQLVAMGANNIWEHSLLDPSQNKQGRRKPNPRDPVHPTKADFIRGKYQFLTYVNKHRDSELGTAEDLSKQLHSSVRTGNLETSLRLLSLGADPNYFHSEKGNGALHVAAQGGQALQIELLVVYGADPGAFDANGKTPVDYARKENHPDIADRLQECQYELTDRLAFYLCGRKPDHRAGQHFIIPEMADSSLDLSELAKAAKKKLQALPNHLFEELAMDVYDEVDRRENETIWLSTQNHSSLVSDRQTVPFLPVNPEFSSTRNQGRQKLARFNAREFATLIIDILNDARRRQLGIASPSQTPKDRGGPLDKPQLLRDRRLMAKTNSNISDDEPLYDSVCSDADEDYASIGDNQSLKEEKVEDKDRAKESMGSSDTTEAPITLEEYLEVKRSLVESNTRVQLLIQNNKDLKQEINLLQNMVHKLMQENQVLRHGDAGANAEQSSVNGHEALREALPAKPKPPPRPNSMFEARDQDRHHRWNKVPPQFQPVKEESVPEAITTLHEKGDSKASSSSSILSQVKLSQANSTDSDYDNTEGEGAAGGASGSGSGSARSSSTSQPPPVDSGTEARSSAEGATAMSFSEPASGEDVNLPSQDDVVKKTEKITKKIQELLISAQEAKQDSYIVCSDKIHVAVKDMASLFPTTIQGERMKAALSLLTNGAENLREQCVADPPKVNGVEDVRLHTQQVIQCAYDIAKAAKQLVMLFE